MTADGMLIEVQGTAEGAPFSREHMDRMMDAAAAGIRALNDAQRRAVS